MRDISQYKIAVFDCDGVILDSNRIKTEAFRAALPGEPADLVDTLIAYHKTHGGVSRYVKFDHYFRNLKKQQDISGDLQSALGGYAAFVRDRMVRCKEIDGIGNFLQRLGDAGIPCVVNSGGDQEELREIFAERGLADRFRLIMGSPSTKKQNMKILDDEGLLQSPGIFFGDAASDYDAAQAYGLDFVFVHGSSEWSDGLAFCRKRDIPTVHSFLELV